LTAFRGGVSVQIEKIDRGAVLRRRISSRGAGAIWKDV